MKILFLVTFFANFLFANPLYHDKKLLMIIVEKEHCSWCNKMKKEIFSDPKTVAKLKKRFYLIHIKEESGNLPLFVHAKYFPSTFVYSLDGTELIDSLIGYHTKGKFLKFFDTDYDTDGDIL